jgi:hypothetical protein
MGLMLWTAAAVFNHTVFEQTYQFIADRISSQFGIVHWGVDKHTGEYYTSPDGENYNSPLDDFRVVRGLISGWIQWRDRRCVG